MHTVLGASLCVCVLIVAWGGALVGFGAAVAASVGISSKGGGTTLGDLGLIGLATFALLACLINFFLPLGGWPSATLLAVGLVSLSLRGRPVRAAWNYEPGVPVFFVLAVLVPALAIVLIGPEFLTFFDTRLYHLQTILWNRDSAVVLGLANLHTKFGYNSLWMVLSAAFSLPGISTQSMFIGNSLVDILTLLALLQRLARLWKPSHPRVRRAPLVYGAGGLAAWAGCVVLMPPTSPNSDLAPAMLVLEVFYLAILLATEEDTSSCSAERSRQLSLLIVLSLFAVTLKTSQVVISLVPAVLGIAALTGRLKIHWPPVLRGAAFGCALLAAWTLRGVALSGCLVYPSSRTCLTGLPWAVSPASADAEALMIKAWPRNPGIPHHEIYPVGWSWLGRWSRDLLLNPRAAFVFALYLFALGSFARWLYLRGWSAGQTTPRRGLAFAVLLCALAGVLFWFLLAPDIRYGIGFVAALPLLILSLTLPVTEGGFEPGRVAGALSAWSGRLARRPFAWGATGSVAALLAGSLYSGMLYRHTDWPTIPEAQVVSLTTTQGRTIYVPWPDPLTTRKQCWANPRPCTPQFVYSLRFGRFGRWEMITRGTEPDLGQ